MAMGVVAFAKREWTTFKKVVHSGTDHGTGEQRLTWRWASWLLPSEKWPALKTWKVWQAR